MAPIHDLYERYATDVYRFALYLSGEPAEAEDITADTFVRLWTTPGEIRTATVKAYLFTIARHLYLDRHRARGPLHRARRVAAVAGAERGGSDGRALGSRPRAAGGQASTEMDRAALLMRANGLSYEEIAEAIGASVGAVKVRVHRARRRLSDAQHQGEHI